MVSTRRKVFRIGKSLAVTIPKIWIDDRGLKPGDVATITMNGDLTIKIAPKPKRK